MKLSEIAAEINSRAGSYDIGSLQMHRKNLRGLKQIREGLVFARADDEEGWAHHYGGRDELQFNIGFEARPQGRLFRHGVAFSFEPSRSLPDPSVLREKAARFDAYIKLHSDDYDGLYMWRHEGGNRSENVAVGALPRDWSDTGSFVFIGKLCDPANIEIDNLLGDFDRLLPLYLHVEGADEIPPTILTRDRPLVDFKPGCPPRVRWTQASITERTLNVSLRHAAIVQALYDSLSEEFGKEFVGTERTCRLGGRIDAMVKAPNFLAFYEVKTAPTARACIREALGQLLDYACWPGPPEVHEIVVVGEPPLIPDAASYLERLKAAFPVPLAYRQVTPTN